MSNHSEIRFCNSCGIMWRVPVSPYGQREVTMTNDSPVDIMITHVEYYNGISRPYRIVFGDHALPIRVLSGCDFTIMFR